MTDLQDLHQAFAELERRADAHAAADLTVRPARPTAARHPVRRPLLVGATAAVLVVGVGTAVALTAGGGEPTRSTAPAAGSAPVTSAAPSVPATPSPSSSGPSSPGASSVAPSPGVTPVGTPVATRFTDALAGVATFTETPQGANADARYLVGVLTSAAGSGGFDVQPTPTGSAMGCSTAATTCSQSPAAGGGTVTVSTLQVLDADGGQSTGVTYQVEYARPDGTGVLFHLSNQRDPKGMSEQLSAQPPLTTAQMTAVVTSPAWLE